MSTLGAGIRMAMFTVVTLLATALLTVTISNATFKKSTSYSAIFSDAVNLNSGDDVRMAGVRVGTIKSVHLYDGDQAKVELHRRKGHPAEPERHGGHPIPQPHRTALPDALGLPR